MGNRSYRGGHTVAGFGKKWSDWRDFPSPEPYFTRTFRTSKSSLLTQAELLKRLGINKSRLTLKARANILKDLVRDRILLPTGQPNINNPKVRALFSIK
jgi:hypothetical protein